MNLEPHEQRSGLWLKMESHFTERLEVLRRKNDGALSPEDTARLRGEIAQCKAFLALGKEPGDEVATNMAAAATKSDPLGVGFNESE